MSVFMFVRYEYDGLWEVLGAPVCIAATERGLDEGGVTVAGDSAGFLCAWGTATGRCSPAPSAPLLTKLDGAVTQLAMLALF